VEHVARPGLRLLVVDVMPTMLGDWLVCAWVGAGGERLECAAHVRTLRVVERGVT
jgi:hypothetical protein